MKKHYFLLVLLILTLACGGLLLYDEALTDEAEAWLTPFVPSPRNERGLQLYREFNTRTDAARLTRWSADDHRIAAACGQFTDECIAELGQDEEIATRYLPRDQEYYQHYFDMLDYPISVYDPQDLISHQRQNLISATRFSFVNDVLIHGAVRPETAIRNLQSHRRWLAESHFLIDKLIFVATFGISLAATRVAMEVDHPWAEELIKDPEFVSAIQPLQEREYSFSNVFAGEFRYMADYLEGDQYSIPWYIKGKRNVLLNRQRVALQAVVDQSVLPHELFWESQMQEPAPSWQGRLLSWFNATPLSIYQPYLDSVRTLDLQLAVLRALRRIHLGADPNRHGEDPIPGFSWNWNEEKRQLCLRPEGIAGEGIATDQRRINAYCMSTEVSRTQETMS